MLVSQYDIEGTFLNAAIQEELYVKDQHATRTRAWKLWKSLYGTKQAAHNWDRVIDNVLQRLGFAQCPDDPGLYFRQVDGLVITIHVDDLLCVFRSATIRQEWETAVREHFTLEERGLLSRFVGMGIIWDHSNRTATVMGDRAIMALAKGWQITKNRPHHISLLKRTMLGRLLFIARMWRPDIRDAVNRLCIKAKCHRC